MKRKKLTMGVCALAISMAVTCIPFSAEANGKFTELPAAGVAVDMGEGSSYADIHSSIGSMVKESFYTTNSGTLGLQNLQNNVSVVYTGANTEPHNAVVSSMPAVIKVDDAVQNSQGAVIGGINDTKESTSPIEETAVESNVETATLENGLIPVEELEIPGENVAVKEEIPSEFENLVIAQVNDYVNVREEANTDSEIVGKLYNESVGTLVKEEDGWYQITSGNVTGYVKAEFCVTGAEAIELAQEVGTVIATVNTTTLKVRSEASTESSVIGLVPLGEELVVVKEEEETEGWVKVSIEEGEGYVSTEYVNLRTDFVKAESREEEQRRLAQEAAARAAAQQAAQQAISNNATTTVPVIAGDSEMGVAVAEYACQFVGNPYVWGGTSLTNGADCSGFVMSVYANFGVSLPHSSTADRTQGYAVDGLANAQPGDLICYSGHVALYIGNNQIVHASSAKTGIIISRADYKKILAIRRIF